MRYGCAADDRPSRALVVAACLLAMACGGGEQHRRDVVIFASGADLQSINPLVTVHPLAKAVQKHVLFMTLVARDTALQPVPRLASFEWDAARTSLTFRLRRDVRWHDGVPTTAHDVAFTLAYARDPRTVYPRRPDLAIIDRVTVIDSFTLQIALRQAQPIFPDVFTDLAILPRHVLGSIEPADMRTTAFNRQPVGNGPFRFVEHIPNQRWVFERAEMFPADLASGAVHRLMIAVVDEPATKLAALTSGELDFAGISPAHAEFVRADRRLAVVDYPVILVYGVFWNTRRPPFDDTNVRRALSMAVDRDAIVNAYLYGYGTPAHGPVPPEHPWHASAPVTAHDPDAARRVLEAAGWRVGGDGVRRKGDARLTAVLLTVGSGDLSLEQMLQAQWRAVGVDVVLRQLELTTFLARAQGGSRDFDALVTGVPGDLGLGYVAALFGDELNPLAYSGYHDPAFDQAVDRARTALSAAGLADAWVEAQRVLAEGHPVTWLYHARGIQGMNRRIAGVRFDLRGELANLHEWRIVDAVGR